MTIKDARTAYLDALAREADAAAAGDAARHFAAMMKLDAAEESLQNAKAGATSLERLADLIAVLG